MQLSTRDGIACDHCGTTYKSDFTYYSFDFRLIAVVENRRLSLDQIYASQIVFSLDICTACFDIISKTVVQNYGQNMNLNVKHRGKQSPSILCEMTGQHYQGTYNYYHCNVIEVKVHMSGQPNICVNCEQQTHENDKPCEKCGGVDFIRPARTTQNDRFLEINIGEPAFKELVHKAETIRKVAGEWATKA